MDIAMLTSKVLEMNKTGRFNSVLDIYEEDGEWKLRCQFSGRVANDDSVQYFMEEAQGMSNIFEYITEVLLVNEKYERKGAFAMVIWTIVDTSPVFEEHKADLLRTFASAYASSIKSRDPAIVVEVDEQGKEHIDYILETFSGYVKVEGYELIYRDYEPLENGNYQLILHITAPSDE